MRATGKTIEMSTKATRLTVGFATTGRAEVLAQTVAHLGRQTFLPDRILISAISAKDHAGVISDKIPLEFLTTARGLTQQRNHILDLCTPDEIVVFFDDDFVPCDDYLSNVVDVFSSHPDVAMVTGTVLADGILNSGIAFHEAARIATSASPAESDALTPVYNGYGCNMAICNRAIQNQGLRFDEKLPLYSWLEDVDFSRLLASHGRIVCAAKIRGVHMGVKSGRTPGLRLGYSQIVNPFYLARKGTVTWSFGSRLAIRNIAANLIKSVKPEPYVDRIGRLRGNLRGLWHIVTRRADPARIIDFDF